MCLGYTAEIRENTRLHSTERVSLTATQTHERNSKVNFVTHKGVQRVLCLHVCAEKKGETRDQNKKQVNGCFKKSFASFLTRTIKRVTQDQDGKINGCFGKKSD